MAPVRDGHPTGTLPKTRSQDNDSLQGHQPRREPFINNTPNNLDQVGVQRVENGHRSGVRRSRKTSNAEIASTQLVGAGLPSSDSRLRLSKENLSRSNQTLPERSGSGMDCSGSSASSSARGHQPRHTAKAHNMTDKDEAGGSKNINLAKMPNREEVQSRLEHLQVYIMQTTKLTEMLQDKPDARHRVQYNKLMSLVAELKDSEAKLRSIINGFDVGDIATENPQRKSRDQDDQKVKSIQAYAKLLETQRAALEAAAANGSFNNQLKEGAPPTNQSADAVKVTSQLENIQSRIQNLHDLQDNRTELAQLLGERDQQLSNEFQLVQNKLRDLHLKKALMNKLIEQVENGMPALESSHKQSPDGDCVEQVDNEEETDSSNDESLGDAEGPLIYSEASTSQSRDDFMEEISAKLDEAERHFLKFQIQGIVNPLCMSQRLLDEREAAFELYETLTSQPQPAAHQSMALEALQAQDLINLQALTYGESLSEPRDQASQSRGSSVKRDNNSRVSQFGKNSSKAPKKVNEERISNARLANLQSIISQVTEQYSQGLPLTDELLNSLGNQGDLVMAENENQARVFSLTDSRSQSRDSLASQCMDELQSYVSENEKRVRVSQPNSSSSLEENSASIQHKLVSDRSRDTQVPRELVDISQQDSSSSDEALSSPFGELLSYEKKKSNAGASWGLERPSVEDLRDMTACLQQQTMGMRQQAASIAITAKEIQKLKSKLPLRDKKTNPQADSQQMLSELQARKGEFEGLMSKHKGCSSSANQDVSDKPETLVPFGEMDGMGSLWLPSVPLPQDPHHSLNTESSSGDDQDRGPQQQGFVTPLNNSASNLAQPRQRQAIDQFVCPNYGPAAYVQGGGSSQLMMGPAATSSSAQNVPHSSQHNNFWPRATNGGRSDNSWNPRFMPPSSHMTAEQEQSLPPPQPSDALLTEFIVALRGHQTEMAFMKVTMNSMLGYLGRIEAEMTGIFNSMQGWANGRIQRYQERMESFAPGQQMYGPSTSAGFPGGGGGSMAVADHERKHGHGPGVGGLGLNLGLGLGQMNEPGWNEPMDRLPPQQPMVLHQQMPPWTYIQEPGVTAALNNQVLPGNRTNNYLDNFRSYSRQNLLSGQPPAGKMRGEDLSSSGSYQNMPVVSVAREQPQNSLNIGRLPYAAAAASPFDYQPPGRQYDAERPIDFPAAGRRKVSRGHFSIPMAESHGQTPGMSRHTSSPSQRQVLPPTWYTIVGTASPNENRTSTPPRPTVITRSACDRQLQQENPEARGPSREAPQLDSPQQNQAAAAEMLNREGNRVSKRGTESEDGMMTYAGASQDETGLSYLAEACRRQTLRKDFKVVVVDAQSQQPPLKLSDQRSLSRKSKRNTRRRSSPSFSGSSATVPTSAAESGSYTGTTGGMINEPRQLPHTLASGANERPSFLNPERIPDYQMRPVGAPHVWGRHLPEARTPGNDRELDQVPTRLDPNQEPGEDR